LKDDLSAPLRLCAPAGDHWRVERLSAQRCAGCATGCAGARPLRLPAELLADRSDGWQAGQRLELRVSRRGLTATSLALYGLPLAVWFATLWGWRDGLGESGAGLVGLALGALVFVAVSGCEKRLLRLLDARCAADRHLEFRMSRTDIRPAGDDL